jgi:addiction module HigA family antidote
MFSNLNIIKGIHPGFVVEREIKRSKMKKKQLSLALHEHPQTVGAILKAKRNMNTALALKIERLLGMEEGYLMILQVYYDIEQEKVKNLKIPNLDKLRPALFWDTNPHNINWDKQKSSVIRRVFERGNEIEKDEIRRFYGEEEIEKFVSHHDSETIL